MIALRGIVHGKTIELIDPPEIAEGAEVQVFVRVPAEDLGKRIKIIQRYADTVADWWTDEDDRILDEIAQDRKRWSHRKLPE
jgi:hypothetical protein